MCRLPDRFFFFSEQRSLALELQATIRQDWQTGGMNDRSWFRPTSPPKVIVGEGVRSLNLFFLPRR